MKDDCSDSESSSTKSFSGIFSVQETLVPVRETKRPSVTQTSLGGLLERPLKLKEDSKEGCGGQLWPAGEVLARYMVRYHKHDLADKTILELGAGSGLVGLAIAQACCINHTVQITDQKPMLALMQDNIRLNSLTDQVSASVFDWGSELPSELTSAFRGEDRKPGIILAADCVYFEPAFPLLKDTLVELIGQGTVCYFCFKKRRKADWRFMKMIGKLFDVRNISEDEDNKSYSRDSIYLYQIKKKAS